MTSKFRPHTYGMAGQGFRVAGELNGRAKLTAAMVRKARRSRKSTDDIAGLYGVCESTVRRACARITWGHVA